MKITFMNGSPKKEKSNTETFINCFLPGFSGCETQIISADTAYLTQQEYDMVLNSDVLVFAFPLYVDSLPSHFLKLLVKLEKLDFNKKEVMVYCIINNGFYEGVQCQIACEIIKNWCDAAGLKWGQGLGIGAGEMSPSVAEMPLDKGPFRPLSFAADRFVKNIKHKSADDNLFVSPLFPRFLWRIAANYTFWLPKARANGLKSKDIFHS